MFKDTKAFSSFSVDDVPAAKRFYGETLGVKVTDEMGDGLGLHLGGGHEVFVYPKENHEPASHTVLNFVVDDVDAAVDRLADAGISLERYEGIEADEKGIMRDQGAAIAWFTDPAGNTLAVVEEPA
jgi:predicted enzyme related to lactoylglutathione lyase